MSNAEPPSSALQEQDREIRVVFFGRRCRLSALPLSSLLDADVAVAAIVVPARVPGQHAIRRLAHRPSLTVLPMAGGHRSANGIDDISHRAGIPLYEVGSLRANAVAETIAALRPDLLVLSCFPWRIPPQLLAIARLGGLNLHPSLLPQLRGPDPLFWAYRFALPTTGVTIHQLEYELDAGPVVAQATLSLPPGLSGDELERRTAMVGGALLVDSIRRIARGEAMALTQDVALASYQSWPKADDLRLQPEWSVKRVRSFVRGVVPLGYKPWVTLDGQDLNVSAVVNPDTSDRQNDPDIVTVRFADGVVDLRVRRTSPRPNRRS